MKRAWAWALTVVACGPTTASDGSGDGDGSGTTAASSGATSTSAATGSSSSSEGETTSPSTTLGDTTASTDPTASTETGEALCPPPEPVLADFSVAPDEDIAAICTVMAAGGAPGASELSLDCEGQPVTLTVSSSPPSSSPEVTVGQQVALEYVTDPIFWVNRWLALRTTGGESDWLLVGGVSGSALDPPGTTLDAFFGDPSVTEVEGLCEPFDDDCGPVERLALDFTLMQTYDVRAFDQGTAFIDILAYGYWFVVESANRYPRPQACDDVPPAWYQLVLVWFSSD